MRLVRGAGAAIGAMALLLLADLEQLMRRAPRHVFTMATVGGAPRACYARARKDISETARDASVVSN
jgi:hypothetical protein